MRGFLWGIFFGTVAFIAERFLMDAEYSDKWVGLVALGVAAACLIAIIISAWVGYRKGGIGRKAGRADMWEKERQLKGYAALMGEFWASPAGNGVREDPCLDNDSVRIAPIQGGRSPQSFGYGVYTIQFSPTHVAHVQIVRPKRPRTWRRRVIDLCIPLANRNKLIMRLVFGLGKRWGFRLRFKDE